MENVSEIFNEDTKEKKIIAKSARRTRTAGKLIDEKNAKRFNSPIITTHIYEDVMSYNDFNNLPRRERWKALHAYLAARTGKELSDIWGVNKQQIYDARYRLDKEFGKIEVPSTKIPPTIPVKTKPVKEIVEECIKPVVLDKIYPVVITLVKELSGEQVQNYIMKVIDLLDADRMIQICLDLQRYGEKVSKFNISMKIEDTVKCSDLADEILNGIGMLPQTGVFQLTLSIKEIKG